MPRPLPKEMAIYDQNAAFIREAFSDCKIDLTDSETKRIVESCVAIFGSLIFSVWLSEEDRIFLSNIYSEEEMEEANIKLDIPDTKKGIEARVSKMMTVFPTIGVALGHQMEDWGWND